MLEFPGPYMIYKVSNHDKYVVCNTERLWGLVAQYWLFILLLILSLYPVPNRSSPIPARMRLIFLIVYILPILTYASAAWALSIKIMYSKWITFLSMDLCIILKNEKKEKRHLKKILNLKIGLPFLENCPDTSLI
jgi:hypothetical protein